jgi:hypothetical protein
LDALIARVQSATVMLTLRELEASLGGAGHLLHETYASSNLALDEGKKWLASMPKLAVSGKSDGLAKDLL